MPLASVTAYRALVTRARVQAGETVLITGIGGGVATTARFVIAEAAWRQGLRDLRTATRSWRPPRGHGADGGVNHRKDDWTKTLIAEIGSRPDVVIDSAGGETFNKALDVAQARRTARHATARRSAPRRAWRSAGSSGSS